MGLGLSGILSRQGYYRHSSWIRYFLVLFANDLPDVVSCGSMVVLHADERGTSRVIQCPCDLVTFQEHLNNLISKLNEL